MSPRLRDASSAPWQLSEEQRRIVRDLAARDASLGQLDAAGAYAWSGMAGALEAVRSRAAAPARSGEAPGAAGTANGYERISAANLQRLHRLLQTLRHFEEAGIKAVVLKGAAMLLAYYPGYGLRDMVDVDVLVRPEEAPAAAAVLFGLGWTSAGNWKRVDLRTRMRLHHARAFQLDRRHSLDLHWRVLNVTTPDVESDLWAATETVTVNATGTARVLCPTDQVFHTCLHAVQPNWSPSPRWVLDVLAILQAAGPRVRWDRLVGLAQRTDTTRRLHAAACELRLALGARIPDSLIEALSCAQARDWEGRELALFSRMPPYGRRDVFRWHWYQFRRMRAPDERWNARPAAAGFVDYLRLKLRVRALDAWP